MRSSALLVKNIPPFVVWCRVTVGLLRQYDGVRSSRSPLREREAISRGLACGASNREIAKWTSSVHSILGLLILKRCSFTSSYVASKLIKFGHQAPFKMVRTDRLTQ